MDLFCESTRRRLYSLLFERSFVQDGIMYARSQITNPDSLCDRLAQVFRDHGYDGASIATLATSAGLSKASLYHHFPGGKQEMAAVLIDHAIQAAEQQAFNVLRTPSPAAARLEAFLEGFLRYTVNGKRPCLLAVLGQAAPGPIRDVIKSQINAWQVVLESSLIGLRGVKPKRATRLAEEVLCGLYGASLLGQLLGDETCMERSVKRLRKQIELYQ